MASARTQLKESMALTKKEVSNHIPRDISFLILSKLPVKSLKRFTCVCKFWANFFEKPQFMSMYLSKYDDHHNSRLLLKQTPSFFDYDDHDYLFLLLGETFENSVKLDWPPPIDVDREGILIAGSIVNGILCLCQGNGRGDTTWIAQKVVLWNPSTEEFKVIPNGSFEHAILKAFPPGTVFEDLPVINTIVNIHGFGYDPVSDDYKLIRCFCFFDNPEKRDPNDEILWQIYDLRSNCWRDLQVEMPSHLWTDMWQETGYAVYLQGMCHWWGYEDYFGDEVLVSFNLSNEVFITTPFNHNYGRFAKHMVVLKESIAMIEYQDSSCLYISILGEFGVADSWTRLLKIGPLPGVLEPIGVGKNGDIFYINYDEEVARFDLNAEVIEDMGVNGRHRCSQMVIYNESLLPIGGMRG
ncbi:putative F-box domain, galactose oxidase/kelch, beta-propeller, F-box associated interaction [Medicago truncatula]|uniref:Putative F-box domain, galactose oxidase/kelch, beta-propeller, F-box associated interaction n=2 Tax=Medicago truncatula TaxID=3880 RepID=A0A396IXH3_MEDTR|nr:putative F-box domain, galactose oxidase/kelch, beta-propeller, F-box associated interaction [Medicago truncatula]